MKDKNFFDAYKEYQNILFKKRNANDTGTPEMTALKTSNIVDEQFFQQAGQAINAINVGLDALLEETKNKAIILGHEIEKEEINSIVENLK
ncbi:unnamed protein product [Rotaria sp. Silwood2]|nr:unnamed protein product [Rotaria sp. Silwood2]CAF2540309.1 unnamed protein product [Rotaria sp. Silwood2]CAF3504724.1 unnamed protein product [Rotaria sp. Silwood2]CAF4413526.1 unnamed protein product [Rotaria sp. Silwood2]